MPVYLGDVDVLVGLNVHLVGYGLSDGVNKTGLGVRRETEVTISGLDATHWVYDYRDTQSGACRGDSGGPGLALTTSGGYVQVGATSFGPGDCLGVGHYNRLDLSAEWLQNAGVNEGALLSCETDNQCNGSCIWDEDCAPFFQR